MLRRSLISILLLTGIVLALPLATHYELADTLVYEGLGSNSVTDIVQLNDSTFLFSTGNGLSITYDRGENIYTYYPNGNSVAYGSVTGAAVLGEHIWVATAYDTSVLEGSYYKEYPKGNGVSYSPDGGQNWQRFPQSVDEMHDTLEVLYGDSISALPITSRINNLIYDLSAQITGDGDTVLWSANFAGGCRRSRDKGETWERVVLPPDRYDMLNEDTPKNFDLSPTSGTLGYESNLNHRAFSVHAIGDTVLVGTANGINISYDNGRTWEKYTAQNSGICGNFIVDVMQGVDGTFYGVALPTQESETRGLAVSGRNVNGMLYWNTYLNGKRLYDIEAGEADRAYAASDEGLWYSADGWNWQNMGNIHDENGQYLLTEDIYCALEDKQGLLWAGTSDGVATTSDLGLSWDILRRVNSDYQQAPALSAYPNPFSPSRMNQLDGDGYVRIHCHLPDPGTVNIEIFDFSMTRVKDLVDNVYIDQENIEFTWNARNGMNDQVANGVYFIRLLYEEQGEKQISWTKLIVLD
ncbi:MAG: two-component regulator propeller domain-containing protein [Candidatus Marinimicrobia bacterium]|nr:two-component regulator propeller domain-containing protein [Candidatus Neomarinimicrobiota bacterium]